MEGDHADLMMVVALQIFIRIYSNPNCNSNDDSNDGNTFILMMMSATYKLQLAAAGLSISSRPSAHPKVLIPSSPGGRGHRCWCPLVLGTTESPPAFYADPPLCWHQQAGGGGWGESVSD